MDRNHHLQHPSLREALSGTLQKLQARLSRKSAHFNKRPLGGLVLLIVSLLAANWAQDLSEKFSLARWKKSHPPSLAIWTHSLATYGFKPVEDSKLLRKLFRTLPSLVDEPGSIWLDKTGSWIATFHSKDPMAVPLFHTRQRIPLPGESKKKRRALKKHLKKTMPSAWNRTGYSWDGFERLLRQIEKLPPIVAPMLPAPPIIRTPRAWRDPRELSY